MNVSRPKPLLLVVLLLLAVGILAWGIHQRLQNTTEGTVQGADQPPVPVEVAVIERGPIELLRTLRIEDIDAPLFNRDEGYHPGWIPQSGKVSTPLN